MDYWHSYFERLSKKYKLKAEIRENEHKILFFIKFYKLQIYRTGRTIINYSYKIITYFLYNNKKMIMYNIMNYLLTLVPRSFINKLFISSDLARFIQPILILAVAACVLSSDNGARYITSERWKSTLASAQ